MALFDEQPRVSGGAYPGTRWNPYGAAIDSAETRSTFMNGVYQHMALGLGLTGLIAMWASNSPAVLGQVMQHPILLIVAQLGIVVGLSGFINRMSAVTAGALFYTYSALTGLLLSVIFVIYTGESIATTFFVAGGTFGAMSLYGYATKRDLSGLGGFFLMGLIGLVLATVVNLWLHSTELMWITTYIGLLLFVGLTAYDTQRIKRLAFQAQPGESSRKLAIHGALSLYLDFINMFLYLLRILGRRR